MGLGTPGLGGGPSPGRLGGGMMPALGGPLAGATGFGGPGRKDVLLSPAELAGAMRGIRWAGPAPPPEEAGVNPRRGVQDRGKSPLPRAHIGGHGPASTDFLGSFGRHGGRRRVPGPTSGAHWKAGRWPRAARSRYPDAHDRRRTADDAARARPGTQPARPSGSGPSSTRAAARCGSGSRRPPRVADAGPAAGVRGQPLPGSGLR